MKFMKPFRRLGCGGGVSFLGLVVILAIFAPEVLNFTLFAVLCACIMLPITGAVLIFFAWQQYQDRRTSTQNKRRNTSYGRHHRSYRR